MHICAVLVLVNLSHPFVHAPEVKSPQGCNGARHAMLFVLVDPLGISDCHELILTKTSIHEGVYERGGEVLLRRVNDGARPLVLTIKNCKS